MKELSDYRRNLVERLVNTARDFRAACLTVTDAYAPANKKLDTHHQSRQQADAHELHNSPFFPKRISAYPDRK